MNAEGKRLGRDLGRTARRPVCAAVAGAGALMFALGACGAAEAAQFETIYRFTDNAAGRDPSGDLAVDDRGVLFGTTERGGKVCPDASYSCGGTIYRLKPPGAAGGVWRHNILHSFAGGRGGSTPRGGVVWHPDGILSGTTNYGGSVACAYEPHGWGCGTVFQLLSPEAGQGGWTKRVLHRFRGDNDGRLPDRRLSQYLDGTLFGATTDGGSGGNGVAFKVEFPNGPRGSGAMRLPPAPRSIDYAYLIIKALIKNNQGVHPLAIELSPPGTMFLDDCVPLFGPAASSAAATGYKSDGSLYGATQAGGSTDCVFTSVGCGVIYRFKPPADPSKPWRYVILHSFLGGSAGAFPNAGVTIGPDRSLYGTTSQGGALCPNDETRGCGVVYRLLPPSGPSSGWRYRVLYRFKGGLDGAKPVGQLALGADGALYGATREGGGCTFASGGCGTVYKLTPPSQPGERWKRTILHRFQAGAAGAFPNGSVLLAPDGAVYGVTTYTIYRITP